MTLRQKHSDETALVTSSRGDADTHRLLCPSAGLRERLLPPQLHPATSLENMTFG